jgi:hypothetical protein
MKKKPEAKNLVTLSLFKSFLLKDSAAIVCLLEDPFPRKFFLSEYNQSKEYDGF